MASSYEHVLERRATGLASAMKQRINTFSTSLTPPGTRPPFTQTLGKTKALDMILNSWHLPAMQNWIGQMDPQSRLELHNALSQHILDKGLMNNTAQPNGVPSNGSAPMDRATNLGASTPKAGNFGMIRNLQ